MGLMADLVLDFSGFGHGHPPNDLPSKTGCERVGPHALRPTYGLGNKEAASPSIDFVISLHTILHLSVPHFAPTTR